MSERSEVIARWLESRGYYKMEGPLFDGFWSWWGKLNRAPREGETPLDVAIEEQTRLERTITAVFLEIGLPVTYSQLIAWGVIVPIYFVLVFGLLALV